MSQSPVLNLATQYAMLRESHKAWSLLNARRAPLILACAEQLFLGKQKSVMLDDAVEMLAQSFSAFANDSSMDIDANKDPYKLARKEWKDWLARGLITERDGEVFATDALERTISFVKGLQDDSLMTSTASRLATVQDRLSHVALHLDPNKERHEAEIKAQIEKLQRRLSLVKRGEVSVLKGRDAAESIKDVYQLAMSLRGDFRRVEDSYRAADKRLRERVIRDDYHRGDIVTSLLDTHDDLLDTPEGQVFHAFNQALKQKQGIDTMKQQIRQILSHPSTFDALTHEQASEFKWLVMLLNKEAQQVSRARERSERDVRGFLQTGLATEHHRVGELLKEILHHAIDMDWSTASMRRAPSVLPPIAIALDNLPTITRLAVKELKEDGGHDIEINTITPTHLDDVADSFWQAFDGLDRADWFAQTMSVVQQHGSLTLAQLAEHLPPPSRYDFEAIAMWLELGMTITQANEQADEQANEQAIDTEVSEQETKDNDSDFAFLRDDLSVYAENHPLITENLLLTHGKTADKKTETEPEHWRFTLPKVTLTVDKLQAVAEQYV